MKKQFQGFMAGVLTMVLLFSGFGFAAAKSVKIEAFVNQVKLSINGSPVATDNLVYKGTLYVPADKVAAALKKSFSWDKKSNTAAIYEPVVANKYNMANPAPIGTSQVVSFDWLLSKFKAQIKVLEVMRGAAALEKVKADNMFNEEPPAGKEYVLVKVEFKLLEAADGKSYVLSYIFFNFFNAQNKKYADGFVSLKEALDTELYAGSQSVGWIPALVDVNDNAKFSFGTKYDGTGGVWFGFK